MAASNKNNVRKYKKTININIGAIFFAVMMIYIIVCIVMYFKSGPVYGYEVKKGSLSESNVFRGIAIRDEKIVESPYSGYINYFAREGEKCGAYKMVCTVDGSGKLKDYVDSKKIEGNLLSDKDLLEIKNEVKDFTGGFSSDNFRSVYDFKFNMEGTLTKYINSNLLNNLTELYKASAQDSVNVCTSPQSGVVVYSVDGFENKRINEVTKDWFDESNYERKQLISNEIVSVNDPIYKLTSNENWNILIQTDAVKAEELLEEEYVKVKFLKNQYESWAKVDVIQGVDESTFVSLSFTNSMISFVTDRFIDVELMTDTEIGLKVPNSSIVEKEFFLIPTKYITVGTDGSQMGVLRETYQEDGTMIPEFVPVTIHNEVDGEYYVDDSVLRVGDVIDMPDFQNKFTIAKAGTLVGVYNINKGYADFKQIEVLNQNDEYSIIRSNTQYGLVAYDYIVLDAESVEDDDILRDK